MPDWSDLLKEYLKQHQEELRKELLSDEISPDIYRIQMREINSFLIMIYKVVKDIKDFEDTVSGSGG